METYKEEITVAKRPFDKETSKEDESVEVKSRRKGNPDSQESKDDEQIIQEKQQIMEDVKDLQVQIGEKLAQLRELTGSEPSSETPSKDLKVFSFDLKRNNLKELPSFNHLEEFQIKGQHEKEGYDSGLYSEEENRKLVELMKYLVNCPNLKILKIEYEGETNFHKGMESFYRSYPYFEDLESNYSATPYILRRMKFQNLEELHLNGFESTETPEEMLKVLNTFHKNLPKLRRLCFMFENPKSLGYFKILQRFASEKNITIEISSLPEYDLRVVLVDPSNVFKIFKPEQGGEDFDGKELDGKDLGEPKEDSDDEEDLEDGEDGKENEGDD